MDKKTVFTKTAKGESEGASLSSDLKRILSLIDSKSTVDELARRAPPSLREGCKSILGELAEGGFIRDKNKPQFEPKITPPKFNPLKMFTPKPTEELDFHTPSAAAQIPNAAELAELAAKQKAEEAAQLEAAVAAAKARANAEAVAKAEAKARQEAEILARGKALAEADAAAKAEAKAKKELEIEERAKAVAEENAKREAVLRAQAADKAKQEAAAKLLAEQEAARNKAALEAAIRVRAEIEAAAKAQQVAEAKAKQEAAARMQAQQEAARVKAALEVAAREKAEAEEKAQREAAAARLKAEQEAARVKAQLEAAAKAKLEAEAALLKAEQEAARIRAEMAAAKARAEAEAKALAEARAKQEAEAKALAEARARQEAEEKARREAETARLKAEHEAALIRAEQEAVAKVRAEAEARARQDAEERARREAEASRLKAEYEAALVKAEQDAVARVRAEAEAKLRVEEEAKSVAAALARQLQEETVAKLAAEALAQRASSIVEQAVPPPLSRDSVPTAAASHTYEIQLDGFMGTVEPVAQTYAPTAQQAVQNSVDEYHDDIAKAKAESEPGPLSNVAAEMARLKEESEAARRRLEEEERRKAEELALAEEQARAWAEAEQRAKMQSLIESEQLAQQAVMSQAKAMQKPNIRAHRKPLPWGTISLVLVALALLVTVVLPYVYPLTEYIVPLEQRLSAQMKQPVHIGSLSASSLPPRLHLHNVTLGNAQEIKVGSIELNFDVVSLFTETRSISNAELQDVSVQGNQLDKQAASLKLIGSNVQYPVRHVSVQGLKIVTDEVTLPVLSGIAEVDAQGALNRVALHSSDDKLGVDLQSNAGHWQLAVSLKETSLFFLPNVAFSDLSAKGELVDGEINFSELDAHIYNGILRGNAKLNWRKGWQLQGLIEAKTFELNKMFPKYGIEGELFGEGTFSFAGSKLSQLDDAPHLDGSFSLKNGTISGFDMVETARLQSREHMVGGRTRFDDLNGLVQYDNGVTRFRQVKIVSNTLSASGLFDVSATNQLGGNFSAEIKMRSGNNALTLFGTLTEPKLRAGY